MSATATGRKLGAGFRLWGRVVRSEPALAVAIAVATLVGAVLVATGARLLHQVSEDDLRQAAISGQPEQRSVRLEIDTRIGPAPTGRPPFDLVRRKGEQFLEQEVPERVRTVIDAQHFVVESPPFVVSSFPDEIDGPFPTAFRFRYQDAIEEELTVVTGRLPAERDPVPMLRGPDCPEDRLATETFEATGEPDCRVVRVPVHEVAVTATTAEAMGLEVGDLALLRPDRRHPAWAYAHGDALERRIILSISAIVELSDLTDEYWYADSSLHRPRITENPDFRFVFAAGVFDPDRYRSLIRDMPETHYDYTWRYLIDPDRLAPDEAGGLAVELEKLGSTDGEVITLLPDLIDAYLAQRALTVALMSTAFTGVLVVSGATIYVLASLATRRQDRTMQLLLERGAARPGLVLLGLVHGLVVAVPAAAVALAIAAVIVPEAPWTQPVLATAALALSTVLALVAAVATVTAATARVGSVRRPVTDARLPAARRVVRDGLIVVVGVAAIALVRRRAAGDDPGPVVVDFDVLLAIAPALIALAMGVVVLWLIGPLVRFLAFVGGFGRGLTPFVGFRRLSLQSRAARSSMMVVLLATTVAGFSTAVRSSVAAAQEANAWQLVGADVAVRGQGDGVPLPSPVAAIGPELTATAAAGAEFPLAPVLVPADSPRVNLLAIDTETYRSVLTGTPTEPNLLDVLGGEAVEGGVVPAIVSQRWPGGDRPGVGDDIEILVGVRKPLVVAAVVDSFPSLAVDQPFVVVDLDRLQQVDPLSTLTPTVVFLRATGPTSAEIAAAVDAVGPTTRLLVRHQVLDDLSKDPFILWVGRGLVVLAGFAVVLAVAALLAGLAITAPARRRDLTLLAAMGLRSRQAIAITAIEHFLPAVLAVAVGTGLALGLAGLLAPALELDAFAGGPRPVAMALSTPYSAGAAAAIIVAVGAATMVVVRVESTEGGGTILSEGEE